MNDIIKVIKQEMYIGLSDKDDVVEKYTISEIEKIIGVYCKDKKVAFSITKLVGGYEHSYGYIIENSIKLTLIGIDNETFHFLGKKLKEIINTDTIMYTSEECEMVYI